MENPKKNSSPELEAGTNVEPERKVRFDNDPVKPPTSPQRKVIKYIRDSQGRLIDKITLGGESEDSEDEEGLSKEESTEVVKGEDGTDLFITTVTLFKPSIVADEEVIKKVVEEKEEVNTYIQGPGGALTRVKTFDLPKVDFEDENAKRDIKEDTEVIIGEDGTETYVTTVTETVIKRRSKSLRAKTASSEIPEHDKKVLAEIVTMVDPDGTVQDFKTPSEEGTSRDAGGLRKTLNISRKELTEFSNIPIEPPGTPPQVPRSVIPPPSPRSAPPLLILPDESETLGTTAVAAAAIATASVVAGVPNGPFQPPPPPGIPDGRVGVANMMAASNPAPATTDIPTIMFPDSSPPSLPGQLVSNLVSGTVQTAADIITTTTTATLIAATGTATAVGAAALYSVFSNSSDEKKREEAFTEKATKIDVALPKQAKAFVNCKETSLPDVLKVSNGVIPEWLNGAFYVVGPGTFDINYMTPGVNMESITRTFSFGHVFDALPLVQRIDLNGVSNTASYVSRHTADKLQVKIHDHQGYQPSRPHSLYRTNTNQSMFAGLFACVKPPKPGKEACAASIYPYNIQSPLGRPALVCQGNGCTAQKIDPTTLSPTEGFTWNQFNPKFTGVQAVPQPRFDAVTGELITVLMNPGYRSTDYHVVSFSSANPEGELLATINSPRPSIIHSFSMTSHFIILTVFPFVQTYSSAWQYFWGGSILDNLAFDKTLPTEFYVISRSEKRLVASYSAAAFFALNHVNAMEFPAGDALFVDVCAYEDASILQALGLPELRGDSNSEMPRGEYRRYQLPHLSEQITKHRMLAQVQPYEAVWKPMAPVPLELPAIHPERSTFGCRYVYGLSWSSEADSSSLWDSIVKIQTKDKSVSAVWHKDGVIPSAPVFIPRPSASSTIQGNEEDDGVLLSVIFDLLNDATPSFLLILDASNLNELARVKLPKAVPPTMIKGCFI